jgi:two-component system chemotaxis sensor kinase CheA
MIDTFRQSFIEEASELLIELENSLLEIEKKPEDEELISKIFRSLHTIKGSAGMFGYDDIAMFIHDIETVYDYIRNGKLSIDKNIIDLTLAARDQIFIMLRNTDGNNIVDESLSKNILSSFHIILQDFNSTGENTSGKNTDKRKNKIIDQIGLMKTYHIFFKPEQDIFLNGTNPVLLISELCGLGDSIVQSNEDEIPPFEELDPEKCYLSWDIVLQTDKGIDALKDEFIFIEDRCELRIEIIDNIFENEEDFRELERLVKNADQSKKSDLKLLLKEYQSSTTRSNLNKTHINENKKVRENIAIQQQSETASSLRVSAEKLDELVNLVGELVTVQARLNQISLNSPDQNLLSVAEEVERITWSLRDSALNIRMLPIGTTFSKFNRLVRDLSKELGKEVELTTEGAETELDKTVIEKLNDPLIHIIRNSIDHGIEIPSEREKSGKARIGTIHLSASQSGGSVLINISDDGAGLDKEAIRKKAIMLGIISEGSEITDSEIFSLIFGAGFSTATKVSNVSGRGVGMDVVRKAIEGLRGTVEISSRKNEGTTITLKLPLTLAIIDGLLVKIEDDHYILPLSSVEECIELSAADIEKVHGRHIINVRGGVVPYINLRESFKIGGKKPAIEQIVITAIYGNKIGFVVDKVLGQHQTVLKSLGKFYKNIEGVSGATIMGDGTVALILDIMKLASKEELKEKALVG